KPTRWILAASSGMERRRWVLRTLRLEGRSCDSGTRMRFLVGSATSSTAAVWVVWTSVWVIAFMVLLLTKGLLLKPHRIPRFGARFCGFPVGSARRPGPASLPPSFLSSSPATVRSARTGAVKETSDGLVRPAGAAEDTARCALTAH